MGKEQTSTKKRKFPWKTLDPYPNKKVHYIRRRGIYVDAQTGQWFFLVLGLPWIICGTGFALAGESFLITLISFIIGLPFTLAAVYCFLSHTEELKIEAEKKAARDEKQRIWREKRRAERKARKRGKGR